VKGPVGTSGEDNLKLWQAKLKEHEKTIRTYWKVWPGGYQPVHIQAKGQRCTASAANNNATRLGKKNFPGIRQARKTMHESFTDAPNRLQGSG